MSENLLDKVQELITPTIYERFKAAIELRRWPNGIKLTGDQMNTCMQAVVAYEYTYLTHDSRIGYVPTKAKACPTPAPEMETEEIISWKDD